MKNFTYEPTQMTSLFIFGDYKYIISTADKNMKTIANVTGIVSLEALKTRN